MYVLHYSLQVATRAHSAISHCSHMLLKCRVATKMSQKYTLGGSKITFCAIFYSLDAGLFQYHLSVKQFGSRSGPTFCRA